MREHIAKIAFNAQAHFQVEQGIFEGCIRDWDALPPDDLAREEFLAIADAVIKAFEEAEEC